MDEKEPKKESIFRPRAGNTVATLTPTEVVAGLGPGTNVPDLPQEPVVSTGKFAGADFGFDEPIIARKETYETFASKSDLNPNDFFEALEEVDGLPAEHRYILPEEEPKPDTTWILSQLLDRLESLEEWRAEMEARIAKYNFRAQHRL